MTIRVMTRETNFMTVTQGNDRKMTLKWEHGNWQFKLKIPKLHGSHPHHVFQAQQIYDKSLIRFPWSWQLMTCISKRPCHDNFSTACEQLFWCLVKCEIRPQNGISLTDLQSQLVLVFTEYRDHAEFINRLHISTKYQAMALFTNTTISLQFKAEDTK